MILVVLIVFIVFAVAAVVFLLNWRKKRKPTTNNEVMSGTYYLVNRVCINEIEFTAKSQIPDAFLKSITEEMDTIVQNETPFAATSLGTLTLNFANGKVMEIKTIYNMGKSEYDPIIYIEDKQYYISEKFKNIIQKLSKLN